MYTFVRVYVSLHTYECDISICLILLYLKVIII